MTTTLAPRGPETVPSSWSACPSFMLVAWRLLYLRLVERSGVTVTIAALGRPGAQAGPHPERTPAASVLNQAPDRYRGNVAGWRNSPGQGNTGVDQR